MTFPQRLAIARKAKNLNSNALSKRLGISSTAVWNWDHGRTMPRPEMLQKLAQELGVTIDWLCEGAAKEPDKPAGATPLSAGDILAEAKAKLAANLNVPESRIRLELTLVT